MSGTGASSVRAELAAAAASMVMEEVINDLNGLAAEMEKIEEKTDSEVEDMTDVLPLLKKLKEENKKLKEDMKWKQSRINFLEEVKVMDNTHLEKQKLKAENSEYLDIINELGDYMARVDQNAVDVFNEITEDSEHVPSRTLE